MKRTVIHICGPIDFEAKILPGAGPDQPRVCANHTPEPDDYLSWHDWAERMWKAGYSSVSCGECGLFKIWWPKASARLLERAEAKQLKAMEKFYASNEYAVMRAEQRRALAPRIPRTKGKGKK